MLILSQQIQTHILVIQVMSHQVILLNLDASIPDTNSPDKPAKIQFLNLPLSGFLFQMLNFSRYSLQLPGQQIPPHHFSREWLPADSRP